MKKITKVKKWLSLLLLLGAALATMADISSSNPPNATWCCTKEITTIKGDNPPDMAVCVEDSTFSLDAKALGEALDPKFADGAEILRDQRGITVAGPYPVSFNKVNLDWSLSYPEDQTLPDLLETAGDYTVTLTGTPQEDKQPEPCKDIEPLVYTFTLRVIKVESIILGQTTTTNDRPIDMTAVPSSGEFPEDPTWERAKQNDNGEWGAWASVGSGTEISPTNTNGTYKVRAKCGTYGPWVESASYTVVNPLLISGPSSSSFCLGHTGSLSASGGTAPYTFSSLNPGAVSVSADYSGGGVFSNWSFTTLDSTDLAIIEVVDVNGERDFYYLDVTKVTNVTLSATETLLTNRITMTAIASSGSFPESPVWERAQKTGTGTFGSYSSIGDGSSITPANNSSGTFKVRTRCGVNGPWVYSAEYTVIPLPEPPVLTGPYSTSFCVGSTGLLVSASGGTSPYTFSSNNSAVLSVSSSGSLSAITAGMAIITVTDNNGLTDTLSLEVIAAGTISLGATSTTIDKSITVSVTPSSGTTFPESPIWYQAEKGDDGTWGDWVELSSIGTQISVSHSVKGTFKLKAQCGANDSGVESVEYTVKSETYVKFAEDSQETADTGETFQLVAEDDDCPETDITMSIESLKDNDGKSISTNLAEYVTLTESSKTSTTSTYNVTFLKECTVVVKAFKYADENEMALITLNGQGCDACSSGDCPSESKPNVQSVRYSLALGKNAGQLLIHEQKPSVELSTPAVIEYESYHRDVEKITLDSQLRQVLTEKYLMDLTTVDAYEYDIKLYLVAGLAAKVNGLYPTTGLTLAKHLNVKNPEKLPANEHIVFTADDFTGTSGEHSEIADFTYDATDNSWTLKEIDGLTGTVLRVEKLAKNETLLTVNPVYSITTATGDQDILLSGQTFTPEKAAVDEDYISDLVKLKSMTFTTGIIATHAASPVTVKVYSSVTTQNENTLVATSTNALDISGNNTVYTWNFNSDILNKEDIYTAIFIQDGNPVDLTLRVANDNYTGGKALDSNDAFSFDAACIITFEADASNIIDNETNTRTILEVDNTVTSVTRETWKTYPFGRRQLSEVRDPDGRQLARTWEYYSDSANDGGAYGKLKKQKSIDGSYQTYTYTADGDVDTEISFNSQNQQISFTAYTYDNLFRVTKRVESFDRSTSDQGESEHRVTIYDYTPFHGIDDGSTKAYSPRQTTVSIKGQEFSRTYNAYQPGEQREFVCQTAGAVYNADDTLVTVTKTVTTPHFRDLVLSVARPGNLGTNTTYLYNETTDTETITEQSGVATFDPDWNVTVSDGSSTTTINVNDMPQSIVTTDILSNLIIGSEDHTYDDYDRIIRTDFLNGTYTKKEYACCGLRSQTGVDGASRIYHTNALKQRFSTTVSGITTKDIFDALGRVIQTQRYPESDPTDILITSQTTYNLAGEIVSRENKGVVTTLATAYNNGSTTQTATYANAATSITTTNAWGDSDISGTGVYPSIQSNRVDLEILDGAYCLVNTNFSTTTINDAGTLVTRWTKSWSNNLGITVKTENSAGDITRTYTDELARVNKTVAPDGLVSLYTYNAKGQQEKQVLDYDRDDIIDLDELDRVSQTENEVLSVNGQTVFRTTQKSWNTDNSDSATVVNVSDQVLSAASGGTIKLTQSSTSFGLTSTTEMILDPDTKTRRSTNINPDGTYSETITIDGRVQSNSAYGVDDSLISQTTYTYDSHGRQNSQTQSGFGTTDITYFDDDLPKTVTRPLKAGEARQVESYVYDVIGQRTQTHRADGSIVITKFNLKGEIIEESGAGKNPRTYTYEEGQQKTVTSYKDFATKANPAVTTYIYDPQTQSLLSTILPEGDTTSTTYEYSRPKTVTNARGQISTYTYNNAGQLAQIDYSQATMASRLWVYDRLGRPSTMSGPQGLRTFAYSNEGQLDTQTHNGLVTDYDQDAFLRPTACQLRKDSVSLRNVTWSYDLNDGRQKTISANGTDITLAYNDKGFHSYTYNNGTADFMKKEVNRDNLGNISDIVYSKQDNTVSNSFNYTYNQLNLPSRFTETNNEYWDYSYDTQDALSSAQKYNADGTAKSGFQYAFSRNDAGDRTQKTFNGDNADYTVALNGQIQTIADASQTDPNEQNKSYTYDADGNTLTDSKWSYTYNQINQLISIETKLTLYATASPQKIDFSYDIFGNRVLKTVSSRATQADAWTIDTSLAFVYKGAQVIAEFDKLNNDELTKTLVYGPYVDEVLIQTNHDAEVSDNYYPQVDRQYSVRALVDGTCNVVESYDYSPFGKMTISDENGGALTETDYSNYIGYTGRRLDAETGLWYFRARYYSDELGRFLSRDSMGYVDGMSMYGGYFAAGFALDPSGHILVVDPKDFDPDYVKELEALVTQMGEYLTKALADIKKNKDDVFTDSFNAVFLGVREGGRKPLKKKIYSELFKEFEDNEEYISAFAGARLVEKNINSMHKLYFDKATKITIMCDKTKKISKNVNVTGTPDHSTHSLAYKTPLNDRFYILPPFFRRGGLKTPNKLRLRALIHELSHFSKGVFDIGGYGALNVSRKGIDITKDNADAYSFYIMMVNGHKFFSTRAEVDANRNRIPTNLEEESLDVLEE